MTTVTVSKEKLAGLLTGAALFGVAVGWSFKKAQEYNKAISQPLDVTPTPKAPWANAAQYLACTIRGCRSREIFPMGVCKKHFLFGNPIDAELSKVPFPKVEDNVLTFFYEEEAVAYGESSPSTMEVRLKINLSLKPQWTVQIIPSPTYKWGINFGGVAILSPTEENKKISGSRIIYLPGKKTYDPAGMTGDPHASEAVGGSCADMQASLTLSQLFALAHGAPLSELEKLQEAMRSIVERFHGRVGLFNYMFLQLKEAVNQSGSTSYPDYLRHQSGLDLSAENRAHAREYLKSVEAGTAMPPKAYFAKIAKKFPELETTVRPFLTSF